MPNVDPPAPTAGGGPRDGLFVAWMAIGAGASLALLTLLTIGPFVLVAVLLAAGLLAWRSGGLDAAVTGLLPGVGVLLVYVAYLNRSGPGEVCSTSANEHRCTSESSPWPWLVVGVVLVVAGVVLYRRLHRAARDRDQGARGSGPAPVSPGGAAPRS